MNVLGLNFSNDAAAAMVVNGAVAMAVQEERFTRVKHWSGFPEREMGACLSAAGVRLDDLDAIAFFWNPGVHAAVANARMSSQPRHHLEYLYDVPNHLLPRLAARPAMTEQVFHLESGKRLPIYYITHHLAHAAGALFGSPHDEAAILTVDGYGERDCAVIWRGRGASFERLWTQEFPHSLGSFYAAFTQFLGFKANSGEGKLMGLASYGKPVFEEAIWKTIALTPDGFELDLSYYSFFIERGARTSPKLLALLGEPRAPESEITARHQDLAASVQAVFEKVLLHLARLARDKTGSTTLCMSGGATLNCSANGRLVRSGLFQRYFFPPNPGDAGAALGAALYVTHCLLGIPRGEPKLLLDDLGPSHSEDEIRQTLARGGIRFHTPSQPHEVAARLLARGRIGSVYRGRAEFGPRALGNRSTVADPRPAEMKERLNARVKFREPFRPFAPSVLDHAAPDYFEGASFSPFMLRVHQTKPEKLAEARAVTHVDGGARVQTVSRAHNPAYYDLIDAFRRETGTPLLLNTSFNVRGEPIVNSPSDAVKCYLTTDMDFLLIGDSLLVRDDALL